MPGIEFILLGLLMEGLNLHFTCTIVLLPPVNTTGHLTGGMRNPCSSTMTNPKGWEGWVSSQREWVRAFINTAALSVSAHKFSKMLIDYPLLS